MNTVVKIQPKDVGSIPYQEASFDIWDKKYRLTSKDGSPVDKPMDDTYKRVARALADVESEQNREQWNESFLWALRHGAIPAGRVTSNAGALEHKPATSTINCTVSGTIRDSMDDILKKVHEAGLTLKAGCGIGYEFSTLRPGASRPGEIHPRQGGERATAAIQLVAVGDRRIHEGSEERRRLDAGISHRPAGIRGRAARPFRRRQIR